MAKRSILTLYVAFIFLSLICGCSVRQESIKPNIDFYSQFEGVYRGHNYSGEIICNRQGLINLRINSPDTVEGLEFSYRSGGVEIKREQLICSADEAFLPSNSLPQRLREIMKAVSQGQYIENGKNDLGYTYTINLRNGKAMLYCDITGNITKLSENDNLDIKLNKITTE